MKESNAKGEKERRNPYYRWWTFFTIYCSLLLCSYLVERSEPAIAGYSFIVLHIVFFVGIILMMLQNATRKTSHFRWYKVKEGVDYNRWGEFIFDPDVSRYDYFELRRMDPTLPKSDPRGPNIFGDTKALRTMSPEMKWLHFSDELGSYEKRQKMYFGDSVRDRQKRDRLLRKLDPDKLTEMEREILRRRRVESSRYFNYIALDEQLSTRSDVESHTPTLFLLKYRHRIGRILHSEAFALVVFALIIAVGLCILLSKTVLPIVEQWSQDTIRAYWAAMGLEFTASIYLQYKWRSSSKVRRGEPIVISSILLIVVLAAPTVYAVDIVADYGWAILYIPLFLLLAFTILYFGGLMGRPK